MLDIGTAIRAGRCQIKRIPLSDKFTKFVGDAFSPWAPRQHAFIVFADAVLLLNSLDGVGEGDFGAMDHWAHFFIFRYIFVGYPERLAGAQQVE